MTQHTLSFSFLMDIQKQAILPKKKESTDSILNFAVIVPFRNQPQQNRLEQLKRFIPYMDTFLSQLGDGYRHHIIIVEQAQDGKKFNRGQLLNIGFQLALEKDCQHCIFHDVYLLPDKNLLEYYGTTPTTPLHLGAIWEKYAHLEFFFGGVCSFSMEDYQKINGFPNDYWGWGGEDEELYFRVLDEYLAIQKPLIGSYEEMEHTHAKKIVGMENKERYAQIIRRSVVPNQTGLSTLQVKTLFLKEAILQQNSFIYKVFL